MKASIKGLAIAALGFGLVLSASESWAGPKIQDFVGNTTATRFSGAVESNVNSNRDPWVAQVFTSGAECLRIAVVSQGTDLEATLVGVEGRVWQDDDSGGSLRPRINARTTIRGWYPLVLHSFSGASVNADFTIDVTRLPSASCVPETLPSIITAPTPKPAGGNTGPAPSGGAN